MQKENNRYIRNLIILFWGIVLTRVSLMVYLPLTDTTEARYANIALIMSKTRDWITPYFDYGVPYWGKPPLSFWFQAISYNFFGIHDFTPRIPSLIITLLTAWIVYKLMIVLKDQATALWAIIIYFSSMLVYALSGVVLLDPYLTFATTLSYAAFMMLLNGHQKYWGYLFFIGLGIGLLAKGPLALVLVGGTIFIWILFSFKKRIVSLLFLPWVRGSLLMLLIAVPWYVLAENKTPGFLHYFIIGEHFDRFMDSGWKGDLYGHAHFKPLGTIWFMWLYCSLPWGLAGIILVLKNLFSKTNCKVMIAKTKTDEISFYLIWMLFPMLFFTMSANITETYVLYGFPALGILFSMYFNSLEEGVAKKQKKFFVLGAVLIPLLGFFGTFYVIKTVHTLKTEKFLIQKYYSLAKNNEPIYFLNHKEFSEIYYMNKKVDITTMAELKQIAQNNPNKRYFIVGQNNNDHLIEQNFKNFKLLYKSQRHTLFSSN